MTRVQKVLAKLHLLPAEQQQEVLNFAEYLASKHARNGPYQSPFGLWADLGADISEDEIEEARKQMWGGFPREDLP